MEQGRMAIATDSTGAVFGIWQGNQHRGAGLVNEAGTFVWNENLSTDPARTRDFYQQVFGYTYEEPQGMTLPEYAVCKVGEDMVGGIGRQPDMIPKGTPSFWNPYFVVTDTDAAAAKIGELGGQVVVPPQDAPFGRFAVARDKGGAGFCVMTPPSAPGQSG
jgi:predicted enzyme related to lactoylglutathione lyase